MYNVYSRFRPQQGLTIMNPKLAQCTPQSFVGFRPQQGLTIMNVLKMKSGKIYKG